MRGSAEEQSVGGTSTLVSCALGGAVWWFLASDPSPLAMVLAALLLAYLFLGYFALAILFPDPNAGPAPSSGPFVPLRTEYDRPKALTL
ncbi:hypothetical protein GMLC_04920 [Geomonas limicola]|uniref:Uncharacterized protein n=1 Tax=Geomonas limicola TaxID=2740186 RepID=A0A6V8N5L7_9BACT|nr:hypothetical protein [Geomonas limicola]GFO66913.1 hypothetical protein GMLC_04920 [Geomonas limicola]